MFDYPIRIPRQSAYAEIGLGPEATPSEIRAAKARLAHEIELALTDLSLRISGIENEVPGLTELRRNLAALESGDATAAEDRATLRKLERRAAEIDPHYRDLIQQSRDLRARHERLNALPIDSTEAREKYDGLTPPFRILKLEEGGNVGFMDDARGLRMLREELAEFLGARGVEVYHPTDLTREDFSADFAYRPLLDGGDE